MKETIWIAEPQDYSPQALKMYRALGTVHQATEEENSKKDHPDFKNATILVVRLKYTINEAWLDNMPDLKIVATPTTGLNHINVPVMEARGVKVISLRGHTSFLEKITSTAEETMALMLALVRKLPWAFDDVKKGNWNRDAFKGHQLHGKTLGILGLGRLGRMVAGYGQALGMQVIACDPDNSVFEGEMKKIVRRVSIEELFKLSDVVSVHVLLTDATADLVREEHFKLMKPTAYFINTARAEIVAAGALEKALEEKRIAGAAVDVMRGEKGSVSFEGKYLKNNPLWQYATTRDNVIILPHTGGATYEAMQVTEEFIADLVSKEVK